MPAKRSVLRKVRRLWRQRKVFPERDNPLEPASEIILRQVDSFSRLHPNEKILFLGSSGFSEIDGLNQTGIALGKPVKKPHNAFVQGDMESLPFARESFGFAVSAYAFDYVRKKRAVKELWRVLKTHAKAIVILHYPQSVIVRNVQEAAKILNAVKKAIQRMKKSSSIEQKVEDRKALAGFLGLASNTGNANYQRFVELLDSKMPISTDSLNAIERIVRQIEQKEKSSPESFLPRLKQNMFFHSKAVEHFFEENGFKAQAVLIESRGKILGWSVRLQKK